ncbi:MAG: AI-2E family transporter [Clostridia bacterium]|nr:AI-2E family transporter [Clostridia bacterium]
MNYNKKDIINVCKIVAFGIILYWALQNLGLLYGGFKTICSILAPFIWGGAIAFVVNIPMTIFENKVFISKKKKKKKEEKISSGKRIISIIISLAIIIVILVGVVFLIIPELVNVISNLVQYHIPNLFVEIRDLTNQAIVEYPQVTDILTNFQTNLESINSEIIKELTTFGTSLVTSSFGVISSAISMIFKAVIAIIFAVYMLMSKEKLTKQLRRMTYAYCDEKRADKICHIASLSRESFYNFITGQLVECIILGSLCAIGMLILRIPYSATVGTLVALTAFIPIVGAMIGAVIAVILILPISLQKAVIFVIFFVILQQIENNVIYPKVVGSRVGVPGMLVLLAVTIGGTLGGAVGMIICLPVTSVLYTLLRASMDKRLQEKGIEDKELKDSKRAINK